MLESRLNAQNISIIVIGCFLYVLLTIQKISNSEHTSAEFTKPTNVKLLISENKK